MSVENEHVADIVSINEKQSAVKLTVSDHLDWSDTEQHQMVLHAKLNRYLAFAESGELLESYPAATGLPVVFVVVFKFRPDRSGEVFLSKARKIIESAGFTLQTTVFAESYDN